MLAATQENDMVPVRKLCLLDISHASKYNMSSSLFRRRSTIVKFKQIKNLFVVYLCVKKARRAKVKGAVINPKILALSSKKSNRLTSENENNEHKIYMLIVFRIMPKMGFISMDYAKN
ncbi:hypothetical protein [Roseivirga sp. UBA1976]|uniref:hypothetical protein n=1 Tax=Roseivirga sp. UBA1976 TaxID=1947386 RepID=UPI00257BB907|nr:hypothetical protein [Roseivirga sp. UBA1976]MEC7754386.1 hypothetical protein [Bacteroidota bacterium]|tara:strand:- start:9492 stop:9845 length:354 start_codon:yes stop_codon:yes gene_type:complete